MKKIALFLAVMLVSTSASAQYFRDRTIVGAGVFYKGTNSILFVEIDGDKSAMTECATSKRFAIDSSMPNYKEIVSFVMAAYMKRENKVELLTDTKCTKWGNAQDILGIKVGNMAF
ncbi:hypothetical protein [Pseudoalteromonas luteoviolacea]|uniref:hypothetical protein n=1 Tax=Pseudoalteromonas luteoviolacea TaxID=43657 RepID=UPI001152F26F|nr:hypothetical protein [Pseudoalteromonas luteoviolacea]TQF67361.1 hypothetical protein FLM44_19425 [Pseudoalteromonas luteoviolacea]